jgi:hypothetical protein
MSKTVNILGDTPKQQWLNAIMIFEECIAGNGRIVRDGLCDMCSPDYAQEIHLGQECDDCPMKHSAEVVVEQTKVFADEMRRLVEGEFE